MSYIGIWFFKGFPMFLNFTKFWPAVMISIGIGSKEVKKLNMEKKGDNLIINIGMQIWN